MNSKDLYSAIGKVDDDVLEQSEISKKKIGLQNTGKVLWRQCWC